jgi:nucleoid-associated protein YgaU
MGLFSFLAEAGEKLGLGHKNSDQDKATAIQKHLEEQNLAVENLGVEVKGGTIVLNGKAVSQEVKEKIILAAGNIEGITAVQDNTQTADHQSAASFYTVKKGDTLSKIAQEVYGSANQYAMIFEANKPMLKSADAIYPGQQLRIPAQQKAA